MNDRIFNFVDFYFISRCFCISIFVPQIRKIKRLTILKLIIFVDLSQINKFIIDLTTTNLIKINIFVAINSSFVVAKKRVMSNNITIYDNFLIYNRLSIVIEAYFKI